MTDMFRRRALLKTASVAAILSLSAFADAAAAPLFPIDASNLTPYGAPSTPIQGKPETKIEVRDDIDPFAPPVEDATNTQSNVVLLEMLVPNSNSALICTGTLINSRTVLTAGHCVHQLGESLGDPTIPDSVFAPVVIFGPDATNVATRTVDRGTSTVVNPGFDLDTFYLGDDVGLVSLSKPVYSSGPQRPGVLTNIPFSVLATEDPTPGTLLTLVGYGDAGTGSNPEQVFDFKRRIAHNVVQYVGPIDDVFGVGPGEHGLVNQIFTFFDDPLNPMDVFGNGFPIPADEGTSDHGDSGGPIFVSDGHGGQIQVGITSGGLSLGPLEGGYGDVAFWNSVADLNGWITDNSFLHLATEGFSDGLWSDPAHWLTGVVPDNFDTPTNQIADFTDPASYYTVNLSTPGVTTTLDDAREIDSLAVLDGARLNIAQDGDLFVWSNAVVVDPDSWLNVDGVLDTNQLLTGPGTILTGNGTVMSVYPVSVGGTVSPGRVGTIGQLSVTGGLVFASTANFVVDFSHDAIDLLNVSGPVQLGGTVAFNPLVAPHWHDTGVFLTAPEIDGSFDAMPDTIAGILKPVVTTVTTPGGQEEVLTVEADSYAALLAGSGTPDQLQIATALDAERDSHYGDLAPLYQAIDPLSGAALDQALENIAPDAERVATLVGDMATTNMDGMIWQHLGEAGAASSETRTAGLMIDGEGLKMALASAGGSSPQSQQLVALGMGLATNPGGGNDPAPVGAPAAPQKADASWMELPNGAGGYVSGSSLSGSVAVGGGGGRADVRGLVVGAGFDLPVDEGFTLGFSVGYSDASATLRSTPSVLQSDALQGAIYARYDFGDHYIAEAFGSYGHQTISTHRAVVIGASTFLIEGHSGGDAPSGGIYFGRSFEIGATNGGTVFVIPSASLQYIGSEIDPFTETGGAPALAFAGYSESSALSRLGFDANMPLTLFDAKITPSVHAFWVDNFEGNNGSIQAAFAAAPSSIMTFGMPSRDRNYAELGFGVGIDLGDVLGHPATLTGRYDGTTRRDVQYDAWTGRLSIKF
ncbi:MAG: autotransporter domain-containing protein [Rhizomicrobium sp.]